MVDHEQHGVGGRMERKEKKNSGDTFLNVTFHTFDYIKSSVLLQFSDVTKRYIHQPQSYCCKQFEPIV